MIKYKKEKFVLMQLFIYLLYNSMTHLLFNYIQTYSQENTKVHNTYSQVNTKVHNTYS
jgi:hypothetical protein